MIDRYDRRMVLLVAQFAVMVVAGVFALLVGTGAIAVVPGPGGRLRHRCRSSSRPATIVTMLVERKDLANAVALNAAAQNACRVTGPALAGVLIAVIGIAGTFAVAALLQILALTATLGAVQHRWEPPAAGRSGPV